MNDTESEAVQEETPLGDEKKLQSIYEEMDTIQRAVHEHNQKWVHSGLRAMFIVPWIFMLLMFWAPSSSKLVFLVLWIASMFIIATFLIGVEYSDYLLQKKWLSMTGNSEANIRSLTVVPPSQMAEAIKERRVDWRERKNVETVKDSAENVFVDGTTEGKDRGTVNDRSDGEKLSSIYANKGRDDQ